jgi:hypothetical protein
MITRNAWDYQISKHGVPMEFCQKTCNPARSTLPRKIYTKTLTEAAARVVYKAKRVDLLQTSLWWLVNYEVIIILCILQINYILHIIFSVLLSYRRSGMERLRMRTAPMKRDKAHYTNWMPLYVLTDDVLRQI